MTSVREIGKGFFKQVAFEMGLKGYVEFIVENHLNGTTLRRCQRETADHSGECKEFSKKVAGDRAEKINRHHFMVSLEGRLRVFYTKQHTERNY